MRRAATRTFAPVKATVHEHIARTMYYFSVHLMYASVVAAAAWLLTSIRGGSATTKYWIWVTTAFNFVVPIGALIDKLWAPHLTWAAPLGVIGVPVWDMTQGWTAVVLVVVWMVGAAAMLARLIVRIRQERKIEMFAQTGRQMVSTFVADGVPIRFAARHPAPAVSGVFRPHILLPVGIDHLLDQREFRAVLLHEVVHARRRDNLIRLVYEVSLCALWFHPLTWLSGARMALYRELSCDESVIRHGHGEALLSALAKLAVPERPVFLQATASSHLSYRLSRLETAPLRSERTSSLIISSLFGAMIIGGIVETVAHTACCFILKR
jgi:beta-lactamase regulating signal transducer with metallopeptidase domain